MRRIHWADLALWVPALFLVYVFMTQGASKFDDTSGWAKAFRFWHFPVWFRVLIGVVEVGGALLLLTRRTAPIGAIMIALVMLGGMGTHIAKGHPEQVTSEVVPFVLSLIILFGRWRHASRWVSSLRHRSDP